MSFISELIGVFSLFMFVIWWILRKNKLKIFYESLPSPPGTLIFGNALDFKSSENLLPIFQKYADKYGGLVRIDIGPFKKILLVSDYKFLEFLLSSTKIINKSVNYDFLIPWLGTGLLTSEGVKWKKHRRIITPAFHFQILEQFIDIFEKEGDIFVEKLGKEVEKPSVNIYPLVTLCTLDIICDSAMGTTVNAQLNEESEYVQSVKEMCRIIVERSISPIGTSTFLYSFTKNHKIQKKALKVLHDYTNSVINRRRAELKNNNKIIKNDEDLGIKKKRAFLDLLLQSTVDGRPLTQQEIREEVDTFMFEGHDTTASAISFALYNLAQNSDVQKKAFQEQLNIFGHSKNNPVTHQDLQNMKYLEMVIKETLRLYPSVPVYSRQTSQEMEFGGKLIPKGVHLTVFAFGIQRDSRYFPDADSFQPSRFEEFDGKMPYTFVPFSAGPRNCIGQKFAMLEMKSTISKVLRNYELLPSTPCHKIQLIAETVLKSKNGINISLKKRCN